MAGKKYSRMLILLGKKNVEAFEFIEKNSQENPMNNIPRIANKHRKNCRVKADITCSSEGMYIKCLVGLYLCPPPYVSIYTLKHTIIWLRFYWAFNEFSIQSYCWLRLEFNKLPDKIFLLVFRNKRENRTFQNKRLMQK